MSRGSGGGRTSTPMPGRLVVRIAHCTRSGDKGDTVQHRGRSRTSERHYPVLVRELTAERVKEFFGPLVRGPVERYELPNLGALNFVLHQALDGGGTVSLRTDAQGKTMARRCCAWRSKPMSEVRRDGRVARLCVRSTGRKSATP